MLWGIRRFLSNFRSIFRQPFGRGSIYRLERLRSIARMRESGKSRNERSSLGVDRGIKKYEKRKLNARNQKSYKFFNVKNILIMMVLIFTFIFVHFSGYSAKSLYFSIFIYIGVTLYLLIVERFFEKAEVQEEIRNIKWKFKKFEEYIELYNNYIDKDNVVSFSDNQKSVWIYPDGNINIGFVNGAECSEGTHIRAVRNEINQSVHDYILTKHKTDIGLARNVDNKYSMFCTFHVTNPAYSSQTKECLTTPVERFSMDENYKFEVPTKLINLNLLI